MEQIKVTATKGAEAGGRQQLGCRSGSETPGCPNLTTLRPGGVVKSRCLEEWAGLMPTAIGLPTKSADRIRTQPSPFRPSRTVVRRYGC